MIYKTKVIFKEGDDEGNSVIDEPDIIMPLRFFIKDVREWEKYHNEELFDNKQPKTLVSFYGKPNARIILEDINKFDEVMSKFYMLTAYQVLINNN